jgi:predicted metalloendopeptidase
VRRRQLDARPIERELAEIHGVTTKDQMTAMMGKANSSGFVSILPVYISIDAKAPTRYTVMANTGACRIAITTCSPPSARRKRNIRSTWPGSAEEEGAMTPIWEQSDDIRIAAGTPPEGAR